MKLPVRLHNKNQPSPATMLVGCVIATLLFVGVFALVTLGLDLLYLCLMPHN